MFGSKKDGEKNIGSEVEAHFVLSNSLSINEQKKLLAL